METLLGIDENLKLSPEKQWDRRNGGSAAGVCCKESERGERKKLETGRCWVGC